MSNTYFNEMIHFNLILFASFGKYSYNEFRTADKKIEITGRKEDAGNITFLRNKNYYVL